METPTPEADTNGEGENEFPSFVSSENAEPITACDSQELNQKLLHHDIIHKETGNCLTGLTLTLDYYHQFIQDFSKIAKPFLLHCLMRASQLAFGPMSSSQEQLTTAPDLAYPDFTQPFILDTDASRDGIGAVLSQVNKQGHKKVLAYMVITGTY